jgi:hypothetical protein
MQQNSQVFALPVIKIEVLFAMTDRSQMISLKIGSVVFDICVLFYNFDLVKFIPQYETVYRTSVK